MKDALDLLDRISAPLGDSRPAPKTMIVMAHPDDEIVGLGGRLGRFGNCIFVHVTDGAPREGSDARRNGFETPEAYALARRDEFQCALKTAGIAGVPALELTCADQQAAFHLARLTREMASLIASHQPEAVVTHPYEGGHPDHDATAFAVHAAVRSLSQAPLLVECMSYHAGPNGIECDRFLPGNNAAGPPPNTVTRLFTPEERELKRRLIGCFGTQLATLSYLDHDFEQFRIAPAYDFTRRPHEGRLFYEHFPWGMDGNRFCELAAQALSELERL